MGLTVNFGEVRGNSIPYRPLFDDVRRNHGFVDLRGRPDLVATVPELTADGALRRLVSEFAQPGSVLMTLGCDLGEKTRRRAMREARHRAGGYVQVVRLPLTDASDDGLLEFAQGIEAHLPGQVGDDAWIVEFCRCRAELRLEEYFETDTLWIWFEATGPTAEVACGARERLIAALHQGLSLCATARSVAA